jgi:hypothetical protein
VFAATITALMLAAAGGPHLVPGPEPQIPSERPILDRPIDESPADRPLIPGAVAAGLVGLVAHAGVRRRRWDGRAPGDGVGLAEQPLVVFVGGHGMAAAPAFGTLIDLMDLDPQQAHFFDYRWVVEDGEIEASETASIDATADALNAFVAGLAGQGRPIYLVGFSKGGAGIAELLARWDEGSPVRVPEVRGAVLLDPPLASGLHGAVQSLGRLWGPIPDDGGYDPIACDSLLRCRDRRAHLGDASGVEVLVIRNPKAGITNFNDHPDGLRIVDAPDAGPGPLAAFLRNPLGYAARASEAHSAVLSDARVAECIVDEIESPGACTLRPPRLPAPPVMWQAGSNGSISVV